MSCHESAVDDVKSAHHPLPDTTKSFNAIVGNNKTLSIELDREVVSLEFSLPNGESYCGPLLGNTPEGSGKYIWYDGCEYEGEWRCGMKHGHGKLKWPSGALYEGEFSGGYMHGTGMYTRRDNTSYSGEWRLSLKHGLGYQIFPNGDIFEGSWIQGTPEGPGKYTWANGKVYLGNFKGGKMSGKGMLTWTNGDLYEGSWLNGMMHGFGVYTWSDGGSYVGTWTRGLKDGKGTFYQKGCKVPSGQQLYLNALRKHGLLPDLRKNTSDINRRATVDLGDIKVGKSVSLDRSWSLQSSIEKLIRHDSSLSGGVKDNEGDINCPILEREYMQGVLINELVLGNQFTSSSKRESRRQKKISKEVKRPGEQIIKGHRSYDLMLNLQLGIRYTVGKITSIQRRQVRATDFGPRANIWMNFPKNGSQRTPPHLSQDFKWKDYCPLVFRNLREMFKIDEADYMMSICGSDALRELYSSGKSGSVFFLSQDDRFIIKTLREFEVECLLRMLPKYHHHVQTYENTLIAKFFGLHRIKPSSGQKFHFVVMGNMFFTELRIHRKFDLKGSSFGRSADKFEIDENTILKDLDLNYCFYLEPSWRDGLLQQIEIDSKFLEAENVMDYSLLLGVHYRAPQRRSYLMSTDGLGTVAEDGLFTFPEPELKLNSHNVETSLTFDCTSTSESMEDEISRQGLVLVPRGADDNNVIIGPHIRGSRLRALSATGVEEVDLLLPGTARLQIQLGVNMPARAERIPRKDDTQIFQEVYDVVLYLGIIDIFQEYNISKKIEHTYKSIQFDSVSISAVDPTFYSRRFLQFIQKVFP